MQIDSNVRQDVLVLTISDPRIDAAGAVSFKEEVRRRIAGHDGRVVLDVGQVEFLDSSGLGALVAVMKLLGGRPLELAGSGEIMRKVLTLTRMDRIFVLHPDLDGALLPRSAA